MIAALTRLLKRVWRYRSAITGKWVTPDYAKKHPETTTRERVK